MEGNINSYQNGMEWLSFAGNKYAGVQGFLYQTGGGSFSVSRDELKLYEISNLANLAGRKKPCVKLFDLLAANDQEKLQSLAKQYEKTSSQEMYIEKEYLDLDKLTLKRQNGKWQVQAPLYVSSSHTGNGSQKDYIKELISTGIQAPEEITGHDTLCIAWETIKEKIPEAKDAVSSPEKDMLAVLTPEELLIYVNPLQGLDKPNLSIPIEEESIVLNQWATGAEVAKWGRQLEKN